MHPLSDTAFSPSLSLSLILFLAPSVVLSVARRLDASGLRRMEEVSQWRQMQEDYYYDVISIDRRGGMA